MDESSYDGTSDGAWLVSDPAPVTVAPSSVLDTGGAAPDPSSFDWGKLASGGLTKLLDVFASGQVAKNAATYGAAPGYVRVPGTNQVVPAGTYATMQAQSASNSTLLMIGLIIGAVMFFSHKG